MFIKKALCTTAALTAALLFSPSPAHAGSLQSDWYKIKKCYATVSGIKDPVANLEISNYDNGGYGQTYHIDMDGNTAPLLDVVAVKVYVDGRAFTKTNDFYWSDSVTTRYHTFYAYWTQGSKTLSCTIANF